jgi:4-hydroxybenzoate polyprenyltransferase
MAIYQINKGINKPIEFKGLKAQYIGYLAGGLVMLLVLFAAMYIMGVPVSFCLIIIAALGSLLFYQVFKLSHKYGEHGLMKIAAKRYLPNHLKFSSRKIFTKLKRQS